MSLLAPQQFLQIRMHGSEMDSTRFSYTVPEHLCAIKRPGAPCCSVGDRVQCLYGIKYPGERLYDVSRTVRPYCKSKYNKRGPCELLLVVQIRSTCQGTPLDLLSDE